MDLRAQHSDSAQEDASVTMQLQRLPPLLLGSYGATLSATDRAALRVLLLLKSTTEQAGVTERRQEQSGTNSESFLAQAGYVLAYRIWDAELSQKHAQSFYNMDVGIEPMYTPRSAP